MRSEDNVKEWTWWTSTAGMNVMTLNKAWINVD